MKKHPSRVFTIALLAIMALFAVIGLQGCDQTSPEVDVAQKNLKAVQAGYHQAISETVSDIAKDIDDSMRTKIHIRLSDGTCSCGLCPVVPPQLLASIPILADTQKALSIQSASSNQDAKDDSATIAESYTDAQALTDPEPTPNEPTRPDLDALTPPDNSLSTSPNPKPETAFDAAHEDLEFDQYGYGVDKNGHRYVATNNGHVYEVAGTVHPGSYPGWMNDINDASYAGTTSKYP